MKKLLLMSALTVGLASAGIAQKVHGKSAVTHSQKAHVQKHVKTQHVPKAINPTDAEIHAINERHKAAIAAIKKNTTLTKKQQKDQVKAANLQHRNEMQAFQKH